MKTTLICTILNEAKTIEPLLESIKTQTRKPDEIIFADAGSSDQTTSLINSFKKTTNLNIRILNKKANRSQGRNYAISKSKHQIIAVTDAGCILDKYWLERITKPLVEDKADSVAGYYLPITPTCFERSVAPFVSVMPDKFNPDSYLPSSRSIAFTRDAWQKVGKYPNHLEFCEDLVFARNLKEMTRMKVVKSALVYWMQSTTFKAFFKQIKNYAKGDIQAGYQPHLAKISTIFIRYLVFIFLPFIFPAYLVWTVFKHYKYPKHLACTLYLPSLQITSDFAIMTGAIQGLITRISRQPRKDININFTQLNSALHIAKRS